ncbi:MAG: zinc ribbon domain-containing protein [bacterium]|nr:zinc ribbon domain-containing protein [bacterium]
MKKIEEAAICQSCSMPMPDESDHGTTVDGQTHHDYCTYCFQNGQFTEPELTKSEMVDRVAEFMGKQEGASTTLYRPAIENRISSLRRWQ